MIRIINRKSHHDKNRYQIEFINSIWSRHFLINHTKSHIIAFAKLITQLMLMVHRGIVMTNHSQLTYPSPPIVRYLCRFKYVLALSCLNIDPITTPTIKVRVFLLTNINCKSDELSLTFRIRGEGRLLKSYLFKNHYHRAK